MYSVELIYTVISFFVSIECQQTAKKKQRHYTMHLHNTVTVQNGGVL